MPKIVTYIKEVSQEIKKVTWPTYEQTRAKTILVIVVSLTIGVFIGLLDLLFSRLMSIIL
ncbi:MAG: preprotein translocase subunit SecE [Patescibacteria group bacterium]|nr:preprotein translocase subunit SecE [Patescibacteria group bacterium]